MSRIILGLLATLLVACALSPSAAELNRSLSQRLTAYYAVLPEVLFKDFSRDLYVRMICFPSLKREWGVMIANPVGETAVVEYAIADRPIWLDPRPQDITTTRITASMTQATAQVLHEAWRFFLQHPERMKVRNFNTDGVACRFESVTTEGGQVSAETWAPRSEYPTGTLVELGEMVRGFTQAEASNQPKIESRIRQRSQELLDWYKEFDRPTKVTNLILAAMVPDHVGLTMRKSPVLYFFISPATTLPIHFTLMDIRTVSPVAEVLLKSPTALGIQEIRLKDYHVVLELDVQYRWYVAAIQNPDSSSRDIVAGGSIERVDPFLVNYYGQSCDKDAVRVLREAGIWYDAFACVTELNMAT
jgi:hypothetical protein